MPLANPFSRVFDASRPRRGDFGSSDEGGHIE